MNPLNLVGAPPVNATDDPALDNISGQTFRRVRKGFDPEEVRTYLRLLDSAVARPPTPAAPPTEPAADRWDGLGQHVARILAQAEAAASAMTVAARAAAASLTVEAKADRVAARDHLAQSELMASSIVAEAETAASITRAGAETQIRQHIADTLGGAQSELDETRAALRDARSRLTAVHALVGRSLGEVSEEPAFASPEDLLATQPAPATPAEPAPSEPATGGPAQPGVVDWLGRSLTVSGDAPEEPAAAEPAAAGDEPAAVPEADAADDDGHEGWMARLRPGHRSES